MECVIIILRRNIILIAVVSSVHIIFSNCKASDIYLNTAASQSLFIESNNNIAFAVSNDNSNIAGWNNASYNRNNFNNKSFIISIANRSDCLKIH